MATNGSLWRCELCEVEVWVRHVPKRRRHALCRQWMVRVQPPAGRAANMAKTSFTYLGS